MGWIGSVVYLVALKRLPGFWFFSIAMDADNSYYAKFIATYASTFLGYIVLVLAMVQPLVQLQQWILRGQHLLKKGRVFRLRRYCLFVCLTFLSYFYPSNTHEHLAQPMNRIPHVIYSRAFSPILYKSKGGPTGQN